MSPLLSLLVMLLIAAGILAVIVWLERRTGHVGLVSLLAGLLSLAAAALTMWTSNSRLQPILSAIVGVCFLVLYGSRRALVRATKLGAPEA